MKHIKLKFSCIALLTVLSVAAQSQTRHVLFLGNSYIYTNNIPDMVVNIAGSVGDTLVYDSHTPGGYTLWNHYNDTTSTGKVKDGGWDFVVVQEQSQLPSWQEYDGFYASYFSDLVEVYNPCARTLFYMTWGRQNGDPDNCWDWPPVCTYEGMDSMLAMRYMEMAQVNESEVSPVGAVWKYIRQNYPGINLYLSDGSHPSVAGSYLAACCFYTSIFKKNPALITYSSTVNASDAAIIRQATKAILFDNLSNWDFTDSNPVADFSYVTGPGTNEIVVTNASVNADFYLWDFGDGTTLTEKHPTHNYASNGTYVITLTATNCDLSDNYDSSNQDTISFCAHTPAVFPDTLILCPGVADTIWTQAYDAYQWFDANGDAIPGATNQFLVPDGNKLYSVMTTDNNCSETSQQVFVGSATSTVFYVIGVGNSGIFGMACIGDTAYLTIASTALTLPSLNPFVNWYLDSVLIPLPPNDSLMITESGMYGVTVEHPSCPGYIAAQYLNIDFVFIECETSLPNELATPAIEIFPNPASERVTISNTVTDNLNYAIVDAIGRQVMKATLPKGDNVISVDGFTSGVYIVTFEQPGLQPLKLIKL